MFTRSSNFKNHRLFLDGNIQFSSRDEYRYHEYLVLETCSACGGAMKVIACIEDPVVIKQILDHLEHKVEASELRALPESRAPPAELPHGLFD